MKDSFHRKLENKTEDISSTDSLNHSPHSQIFLIFRHVFKTKYDTEEIQKINKGGTVKPEAQLAKLEEYLTSVSELSVVIMDMNSKRSDN